MFVQALVRECDFTDRKYETKVKGAYAVAQGATGRWCAVMYAGPEWLAERHITPLTEDEAHEIISRKGGYADF